MHHMIAVLTDPIKKRQTEREELRIGNELCLFQIEREGNDRVLIAHGRMQH